MVWTTRIRLRKGTKNDVEKVCKDIRDGTSKRPKGDPTFVFKIFEVKGDHYLEIQSKDKKQSMDRGAWLVNRVDSLKGLRWNTQWIKGSDISTNIQKC